MPVSLIRPRDPVARASVAQVARAEVAEAKVKYKAKAKAKVTAKAKAVPTATAKATPSVPKGPSTKEEKDDEFFARSLRPAVLTKRGHPAELAETIGDDEGSAFRFLDLFFLRLCLGISNST